MGFVSGIHFSELNDHASSLRLLLIHQKCGTAKLRDLSRGQASANPALSNSSACCSISCWSTRGMGQHFCLKGLPTHSSFSWMSIWTRGHAEEGGGKGPKISWYLHNKSYNRGLSRNFPHPFESHHGGFPFLRGGKVFRFSLEPPFELQAENSFLGATWKFLASPDH